MQNPTYPLVAVRMLTYNHEKYIAQSIESVISQKTNFKFIVLIGEDSSTDNTYQICKQYENLYPETIKLKRTSQNNIFQNSMDNFAACADSGAKYIALIEGDDYWTDNRKLQKQVDFLEGHPDYTISFHKIKTFDDAGFDYGDVFQIDNLEPSLAFSDLAKRNFIPTASIVFRSFPFIKKFPDWFKEIPMGDWPLFLLLADEGKIGFINESMAAYRKHGGGEWSKESYYENHKKTTRARHLLDKAFHYKYHADFFHPADQHSDEETLLMFFREERDFGKYFGSLLKMLRYKKHTNNSWGYYLLLARRYFSKPVKNLQAN